jgi:hypothetical protein
MGKNADEVMKAQKAGLVKELEALNKKVASGKASTTEIERAKEIGRKLDTKTMKKIRA